MIIQFTFTNFLQFTIFMIFFYLYELINIFNVRQGESKIRLDVFKITIGSLLTDKKNLKVMEIDVLLPYLNIGSILTTSRIYLSYRLSVRPIPIKF